MSPEWEVKVKLLQIGSSEILKLDGTEKYIDLSMLKSLCSRWVLVKY